MHPRNLLYYVEKMLVKSFYLFYCSPINKGGKNSVIARSQSDLYLYTFFLLTSMVCDIRLTIVCQFVHQRLINEHVLAILYHLLVLDICGLFTFPQ